MDLNVGSDIRHLVAIQCTCVCSYWLHMCFVPDQLMMQTDGFDMIRHELNNKYKPELVLAATASSTHKATHAKWGTVHHTKAVSQAAGASSAGINLDQACS